MAQPSELFAASGFRVRVVDALIVLLRERGTARFSLGEVAEAAGVPEGRVRAAFPDRDALVSELRRVCYDRLAARLTARYFDPDGHPPTRLREGGRAHLEFARTNPALYRLLYCDPGDGGIAHIIDVIVPPDSLEALTEGVRRCRAYRGRSTGKARELAFLLWTTIHGVAVLALDADGPNRSGGKWDQAAQTLDLLIDLICASGDD
ncbi:hypothetical protein BYZ73_08695 [Rhodovulum viride]|uniref:HTH tetR-type domain-containing protein n=1 Tax=Rhodovulum viride TaxID=1231134 RepID=A0ABX9DJY1_9RHOB|nr:TetR/AcrR family transcriptional regulator [Rhodovulum viride]RAP41676.1 hypothetical protein BYZ73_08695 [Rhodovulum viride]